MGNIALKPNRYASLEGLRGVACVIVIAFHLLSFFYGVMFRGDSSAAPAHNALEGAMYGLPSGALMSGLFAVGIFFVLSGFVLSIGFLSSHDDKIVRKLAIKRYPRLMIPALFSLIVCYVLMVLGFYRLQSLSGITHTLGAASWDFSPHFLEVIGNGIYGIFVDGGSKYNGVLWTMVTEFQGSFLVFGTLLLFAKSKQRWVIYTALAIIFINSWILGFVIGMILADLVASKAIAPRNRSQLLICAVLACAIYFGGYPLATLQGTWYSPFETLRQSGLLLSSHMILLGSTAVVFLVLWSQQFSAVFSKKPLTVLGRYTYSAYLIHLPILSTAMASLFIALYPIFGYNKSAVLSIAVTLPIIVLVTYYFEKYIDGPSVRFAQKLGNRFIDSELGSGKPNVLKSHAIGGAAVKSRQFVGYK